MRISVMVFNDFSIIKVLSKMLIYISKKWRSASYLECIPTKRFLLPPSYVLRGSNSRDINIFSWNLRSQKWPNFWKRGCAICSCQRCQTPIWLIRVQFSLFPPMLFWDEDLPKSSSSVECMTTPKKHSMLCPLSVLTKTK